MVTFRPPYAPAAHPASNPSGISGRATTASSTAWGGRLVAGRLLALLGIGVIAISGPRDVAAQASCTSLDGIPVTYNVQFGVLQGILDANCQGCHTNGQGSGGFLINFDVVRAEMLGPPPENGAAASNSYPGFRRVVPGRPDLSLLFLKLNCSGGATGGQMPLGSSLTVQEQALFFDWIRGGAIMQGDGAGDPGSDRRFVDDFEPFR